MASQQSRFRLPRWGWFLLATVVAGQVQLRGLTNLEYPSLDGTAVTDAGLDQLTGLTKLRELHVYRTSVTARELPSNPRARPQPQRKTPFRPWAVDRKSQRYRLVEGVDTIPACISPEYDFGHGQGAQTLLRDDAVERQEPMRRASKQV